MAGGPAFFYYLFITMDAKTLKKTISFLTDIFEEDAQLWENYTYWYNKAIKNIEILLQTIEDKEEKYTSLGLL